MIDSLGTKRTLENDKSLDFLLFMSAICYSDCLVSRDDYESDSKELMKGKSRKNSKLSKHRSQIPWLGRHFPDNHKASDKQIDLAKVHGIFVPEGFTFVSPSSPGDISEAQERHYRSLSLLKLLFDR